MLQTITLLLTALAAVNAVSTPTPTPMIDPTEPPSPTPIIDPTVPPSPTPVIDPTELPHPPPGGYTPAQVTSANVEMLQIAISSPKHDGHKPTPSICIKHVDSLMTQVVAGTNYKFSVNGCELPKDKYLGYCQHQVNCRRSQFDVVIFDQPWTNTRLVTSITRTQ